MIDLTTIEGYQARYSERLAELQAAGVRAACRRAWESVEVELFEAYGQRRYLSYASFRASTSQIRRRRINKMKYRVILLTQ